jgi:hypothetical protein
VIKGVSWRGRSSGRERDEADPEKVSRRIGRDLNIVD